MSMIQLMYSGHKASSDHIGRLSDLFPHDRILEVDSADEAIAAACDTSVVLGHRFLRQMLPATRRLKWVQASSSGFDHLPWGDVLKRGAILTTADFAGPVIAQHATMLALAMNRRFRDCITRQESSRWGSDLYADLPPRLRIAIVFGLGAIGGRVAAMLAAGGIEVWGVSRTKRQSPGVTRHFIGEEWRGEVGRADLLVVCLPAAPDTRDLINASVIEAMKATAILVNVGRSETVDLAALVKRLEAKTLAGAAIDVTPDRRQLPADSELWRVPGLVITPYLAARYGDRWRDLELYVESQVARWANGDPLQGVVEART